MTAAPPTQPAVTTIARRAALAIVALVIGAACGLAASTGPAAELEARYGLGWLYALRGVRTPPSSVLVVELNDRQGERISVEVPRIDAATVTCGRLSVDGAGPDSVVLGSPRTLPWPRCVHARLVDALTVAGARAIVFDMLFRTPRHRSEAERRAVAAQDEAFAAAVRKSARVVTAVRVPNLACAGADPSCAPTIRIAPSGAVMDAAVATGPMLVPSPRGDIYHAFWLFDPEDFGLATLPLLALHVSRPELFGKVVERIATAAPRLRDQLPDYDPAAGEPVRLTGAATELAVAIRQLDASEWSRVVAPDDAVADLARLYRDAGTPHMLNEYGPTGTLPAIGYADVLQLAETAPQALADRVRGRSVFVGYLQHEEREPFEQFPTHFRRDGLPDVAGVEIAATAFANLADGSRLRTMDARVALTAAIATAVALCTLLGGPYVGAFVALALAVGIPGAAAWTFGHRNLWLPLACPMAAVAVAYVTGIAILYVQERRHGARVRTVLARMVPPEAVASITDPRRQRDLGFGLCLVTDAAGYSAYSEKVSPPEIVAFLDRYFQLLFAPVIERGGFVSDVVGDSMLAIFPCDSAADAPIAAVLDACVAILEAVDSAPEGHALPTRIGVSVGPMTRTMVGALTHYEYRAVGDTVNVANRLEGLNKAFGTRVLVTAEIAHAASGFRFRDHGLATLPGRPTPLHVFALLGRATDDDGESSRNRPRA